MRFEVKKCKFCQVSSHYFQVTPKAKHLTYGDISSNFTFNTNYGSSGYFGTAGKSKTVTEDMREKKG